METTARNRREHFVKGKTIKEIARDLGVSRNTVRGVLRSGETSFEYERTVQPRPKLGRWTVEIDALLEGNAAKPAREQLTLIRIFEEFRDRGYDGGYDAVRRYARRAAHLQEAAIVEAVLADEDRVHRRLHIVVDATSAGPLEQREGPVMGIEHHLLRLARIGAHEQHPAVAKPDVGDLHDQRHAAHHDAVGQESSANDCSGLCAAELCAW